jgi:hypothetical protein
VRVEEIEAAALRPLDRGQLSVLRVRAAIAATILIVAVLLLDRELLRDTALPFGAVSGPAALLLALWAIWSPGRRYRSWGFRDEEEELHLQHGLWTRVRTIVPFGRVQHIDVAQGPVERRFGVARLILHTAGTRSGAVTLPGLRMEEASRLRDHIRSQIRQDLV